MWLISQFGTIRLILFEGGYYKQKSGDYPRP